MSLPAAAHAKSAARIPPSAALRRRVMIASAIGTTVEWYDFLLYGTAAALVIVSSFVKETRSLSAPRRRRPWDT